MSVSTSALAVAETTHRSRVEHKLTIAVIIDAGYYSTSTQQLKRCNRLKLGFELSMQGDSHKRSHFFRVFYEAPKEKGQLCKIARPRKPVDSPIHLNPSSWVLLVQEIIQRSRKLHRRAVVLGPLSTSEEAHLPAVPAAPRERCHR
ncbi:hypothetical protein J6590_042816 [Homalodisca vitripennis]|nr:hypothetical protein J6590_042816 [Homalodisca vitripennis]